MENWSTWRLLLNEHPTLWSKKHWFAKVHCKPKSTCFFFFTNPCVEKCPFTTISMPPWRIPHQFSIKQQCLPPRSKKKDGAVGLKKRVWLWGRWDHQVDTIWWQMRCPLHPTQWKGTFGITRLWSMFHWESLTCRQNLKDAITQMRLNEESKKAGYVHLKNLDFMCEWCIPLVSVWDVAH